MSESDSTILPYFSQNKVLDIFMKQLAQKEKSLLAAYALKTCLKDYKWTPDGFDFPCAGRLIVAMFNKGWLDDAVGQVEGSKIFDDLITFDDLREQVIESGIVTTITKKLEGGECHEVRMGLICLDILVAASPMELKDFVTKSLEYLRNSKRKTQIKGVKILSALAQTPAGEEAIKQHVIDIVKMLLPDGRSPVSRSQLFGSASAVYDLCKNETLHKLILGSDAFETFKRQRDDPALYPQTRETRSIN
ncbi:hypothetical protein HD554DRAFT_2093577 [Boletus coccyginus]|nr:hypothetical protein HD554DRAFT_2093577 [Boletus coccyginus]